jgi:hypothetical protein
MIIFKSNDSSKNVADHANRRSAGGNISSSSKINSWSKLQATTKVTRKIDLQSVDQCFDDVAWYTPKYFPKNVLPIQKKQAQETENIAA